MYISCPSCSTTFVVESEQISHSGRKLRCSKCRHVWFFSLHKKPEVKSKITTKPVLNNHTKRVEEKDSKNHQPVKPAQHNKAADKADKIFPLTNDDKEYFNKQNLPIRLISERQKPASLTLLLAITVMLLASILLYGNSINRVIYGNGLKIKDIALTYDKNQSKVMVNYKIANNFNRKAQIPLARVRLFDKKNKIITSLLVNASDITLNPRQQVSLVTEFNFTPAEIATADIMLGNKLGFFLGL